VGSLSVIAHPRGVSEAVAERWGTIMTRVIAILVWGIALGACSTSLPNLSFLQSAPPTEVLRIESNPPGAEAKTTQGPSCRTPCELKLQASGELSVIVSLDGYQPQTVAVVRQAPSAAAGPRDSDVAAPTARFAPNPVYVELVRTTAAPPAKKEPAKKPRPKAAPAAARAPAPAAAETTTASAVAPDSAAPPPPATTTETAPSATNYPWPSR
jgi:hypothetical protein